MKPTTLLVEPWAGEAPPAVKVVRKVREKRIEERGNEYAKKLGFEAYKFRVIGQDGFPDRMYPGHGIIVWWEWKKRGKTPEPQQYRRMDELRAAGQKYVGWSDNFEEFKRFMDALV